MSEREEVIVIDTEADFDTVFLLTDGRVRVEVAVAKAERLELLDSLRELVTDEVPVAVGVGDCEGVPAVRDIV